MVSFLLCFISLSLLFEQCNNFEAHLVFGFKKGSYTYNVVKIEEDLNTSLGFLMAVWLVFIKASIRTCT
jgi:hypothetical protein